MSKGMIFSIAICHMYSIQCIVYFFNILIASRDPNSIYNYTAK